ncbi:MAG: sarcosine oxidase subunit gamma [Rhodobacteraceae bacterium]|nr:sarcosine oxidase subunit gamma [Paracoccaceae bacterium]
MAEPPAPLATHARLPAAGMVALKADLARPEVAPALAAAGLALPPGRRILRGARGQAAWMAPDELLLLVPRAEAAAVAEGLRARLGEAGALVAEVSDLRILFALEGPGAREALARLVPVDLAPSAFGPGDFRRTRLSQVAAALWMETPGVFRIAVARSVAAYAGELLAGAVTGGASGLYPPGA